MVDLIPSFKGSDRSEAIPLQGENNEYRGLYYIYIVLSLLTVVVSTVLAGSIYFGDNQVPVHGSVVTDDERCTSIGENILLNGGNAVDSSVACAICISVVRPDLAGIGGGGIAIIYDQPRRESLGCYDFQPTSISHPSIGFPRFLLGLKKIHDQLGKLPWLQILEPSIKLARYGFTPSEKLLESVNSTFSRPNNNQQFLDWCKSVSSKNVVISATLADILESISKFDLIDFYKSTILPVMQTFSSVQSADYEVEQTACLSSPVGKYSLYLPGDGSGGPFIKDSFESFKTNFQNDSSTSSTLASLKVSEGINSKPYAGTYIGVIDHNDLYISMVCGLGSPFGSGIMTEDTYLLNNVFELNPETKEGKSISLSTPIIATETDICGDRFLTGGGDARDVIQLLYRILFTDSDIQTNIEAPRVRIFGNTLEVEENHAPLFSSLDYRIFKSNGYSIIPAERPYHSLNILWKNFDHVIAYADSRGDGRATSF